MGVHIMLHEDSATSQMVSAAETAEEEHAKGPLQPQVMRLILLAGGSIAAGDRGCHIGGWLADRQVNKKAGCIAHRCSNSVWMPSSALHLLRYT